MFDYYLKAKGIVRHSFFVTIDDPQQGDEFPVGISILFQGTAVDALGTPIVASHAFRWSSSIDGALGQGNPLVVEHLSVGRHRITLFVKTSPIDHGKDDLFIHVLPPP